MRFSVFSLLAAPALVAGAAAGNSHMPSPPNLSPGPKCPGHFQQPSPGNYRQGRICTVTPSDKDAGPSILAAAHRCNNGGTVYFPAGQNYTIASALDLTFLKDIDFAILGTIYFSDDITIWPSQVFQYPFQGASFFWRFGGENVRIYGNGQGVIDGLGQAYWTAMVTDSAVLRPVLFGTDGLHRSSISGLTMRNPPNWFNFITNSSHILISDMNLQVTSLNASAPAKNTDGFDTYRSSNIVVQDSTVVNTDDCVSFKPNTTDMVVQNLHCTGCHGISVGSLGQYEGEIDIVENIYVYNVDMTSCGDSARIKVWPGAPAGSGSSSGGGTGLVRNITYNALNVNSNDQVIALTQCYGVSNTSVCTQYPSSVIITDVLFEDFSGVLSSKYQPIAGSLVCSDPTVCSNIAANNIAVTEPSGASPEFTCTNIDESELGITCVA